MEKSTKHIKVSDDVVQAQELQHKCTKICQYCSNRKRELLAKEGISFTDEFLSVMLSDSQI